MSFEIALSGINAVNSQLTGISNNIANSGTYGFKSSRTNFASTYAGAQPTGSQASSTTQSISRGGGVTSTGRPMDVAIEGQGFFITKDSSGNTAYTRVGIFGTDKDGNVIDSLGRRVQGYGPSTAGAAGAAALGAFGDLKVPQGQIAAKASDTVNYVANMSAGWTAPATATFNKNDQTSYNSSMVTTVFDSLGNVHNLTQYFVKSAANAVTVNYVFDGATLPTTTTLTFDTFGKMTSAPGATINCGTPPGAAALSLNFNYAGTTSFAGEPSTAVNSANGYASGLMTGVKIEDNGEISATYSNGQKQPCGTLALASFINENGLVQTNNTSWLESPASGAAVLNRPGTGLAGKIVAGSLEQSNVDMTSELVNLMASQRTYQANTKVISTENQMMQALMQAI
ncbi:flagellar hook-basal body complex protein [Paludibacterium paludis]|uniref:Flagellar hook protein FlgE n=1 Tax=Paludibacterium paludis TaxID=1225769 RepID=A0A918NYD2_9NEIS|nr:flagellar hook-basal body complex protein [Paludibacterium paludis]GGY04789.1 flagellar hook protein FlgE [Paludibacterium paludis]